MSKQPSSNGPEEMLSKIGDALRLTDELFKGIKDYKGVLMHQFLGSGVCNAALEAGESDAIRLKWPLVTLNELVLSNGIIQGPEDHSIYRGHYSGEGLPLLEPESLTELRLLAEEYQYLNDDSRNAIQQYIVHGADILMVQEGDYAGASAIVPIFHADGVLGPRCIRIRVNTEICEVFYLLNVLHYYYREGVFRDQQTGDGRRISIDILYGLKIPLPPKERQKQITDSLLEMSGAMVAQEGYRDAMVKLRGLIEGTIK